ncbi:MAG TPA: phospholipase D family protein [Baekduia sp.]|nr:phospholipase D family protein [Baekduia sp.]
MSPLRLSTGDLSPQLEARLVTAKQRVLLASPFVGPKIGVWLAGEARAKDRRLLTDWRTEHLQSGVLSARGVLALARAGFVVGSLAGLHAKIVIANHWAYVGSANLTEYGIGADGNIELGIILGASAADQVAEQFDQWWDGATLVTQAEITEAAKHHPTHRGESSRATIVFGSGAGRPRLGAPGFRASVERERVEDAMKKLRAGCKSRRQRGSGSWVHMHRTRPRILTERLKGPPSSAKKAEVLALLLQILDAHPDAYARAHASYRLAHDAWAASSHGKIRRALAESASDEPSRVAKRAALHGLAHLRTSREATAAGPVVSAA